MVNSLRTLILPAFDTLESLPSEYAAWTDQLSVVEHLSLRGLDHSLAITDRSIGIVPTGIGKSNAATTVATLCANPAVDLDDTLIMTVGVAGGRPSLSIGDVVVSSAVVDWDRKCRYDSGDDSIPLKINPYTEAGVFELNENLIRVTDRLVSESDSCHTESVHIGTNVCGDELWHGAETAHHVQWLVEQHGLDSYLITEMEDFGTATGLERHNRLSQYLSIRGISNFDRPIDETSASENMFSDGFEAGFQIAISNAVSVAQLVIADYNT
jgi:purine nucleoside permease